jgi:hypothetical protein
MGILNSNDLKCQSQLMFLSNTHLHVDALEHTPSTISCREIACSLYTLSVFYVSEVCVQIYGGVWLIFP